MASTETLGDRDITRNIRTGKQRDKGRGRDKKRGQKGWSCRNRKERQTGKGTDGQTDKQAGRWTARQ